MNKKLVLISMLLIVLCSLSAASASEINGTDDIVGVDSDESAFCDIVSASEINGTDDVVDSDSDLLSAYSTSTVTVSTWSNLKSAYANNTFYTPSEYANMGNNQQSTIFADELFGLSQDDVESSKVNVEFSGISPTNSVSEGSPFNNRNLKVYYNDDIISTPNSFKFYDKGIEFKPTFMYMAPTKTFMLNIVPKQLTGGIHEITIAYLGNDNYNPTNFTFNINVYPKVTSVIDVDYDAEKITVTLTPQTAKDMDGNFSVILDDEILANGTFEDGVGTATFDILEPGYYAKIIIAYEGDDKYPAFNTTKTLRIYGTSQWGLPGFDNKNSFNPDYVRFEGGAVLWNATVNNPSSSPIIDHNGNIYVVDDENIKIFSNNGTLVHTIDVGVWKDGAISLFKDYFLMYVRPNFNIVGYDVTDDYSTRNQGDTNIVTYTNTQYAPIFDEDGKIYLSVYFNNGGLPKDGKYLTRITVDQNGLYQYGTVVVSSQPIGAPVLDGEGILWVNTVDGIYGVNSSSFVQIFSNPNIGVVGRPVIDDKNVVYAFGKDNQIYALNKETVLWNVTVNNGIGSVMAIDNENGLLYSVDNNGTLFSYDTGNDGFASEIYNIGTNATSIIVDGNGKVYVADDKGSVWTFDNEKNMLWNIDLNESVAVPMAMDENGIIYLLTSDRIYALGFSSNLTIEALNVTVFDNETVTVKISEEIEGNVTISFNGTDYDVEIENGIATLDLGQLRPGKYTVSATYNGDDFHGVETATATFEIVKADAEITEDIVSSIENSTLTVTLPENAEGIVLAKVNGKGYYAEVKNGTAVISIAKLEPGNYTVDITYMGDDNYNNASLSDEFEVPELLNPELNVSVDDTVITVTINENATGKVIVTVGDISYVKDVGEAPIVIDVADFDAGTYDVTVEYMGDESFLAATADDTVTVPEEPVVDPKDPELEATADNATVTVSVNGDATGYVLVDVDGTIYYAEIDNGQAVIDVKGLEPGNYTVGVFYSGDEFFAEANVTADLTVPEVELIDPKLEVTVNDTVVTVSLDDLAVGYVVVSVGDESLFFEYDGGPIVVDFADLEPGNYTVGVFYSGDEFFAEANATADLTVPEVELLDPELEVIVDDTVVTVSLDEIAGGYVVVSIVDDRDLFFEYDGEPIIVDLDDLQPGNYTINVAYSGDEFFAQSNATASVTIPKVDPLDPELEVIVDDTVVTVSLDEMAGGYVVVSVDGKDLFFEYGGDPIVVDLSDLEPGNYTIDVVYSGDEEFSEANATASVTIPEIEPLDPELEVDIQNTTITVSINENATGLVIITVGDISFVMDAGELEPVDVSEFLTNGTYPVTVEYLGDDVFDDGIFLGGNITVPEEPVIEPKDPNLKATATNATITVSVYKDATGNVLVDVNGNGYYAPVKDGKAVINIIGLDEGKYDAVVTYVGDDVFASANTTVSITVPKKEDPQPEPVDPKADIKVTNETVSVDLPKDATGYLLVDVDGKGFYTPVKDGKATLDLPELAPGNHTVTVTYTGDKKYDSANVTQTIAVEEDIPTVVAENLTKIEKAPDRFEAVFTDAEGKPLVNADVTFEINGNKYTRTTDANGKAGMAINLVAGNYTVVTTNPVTKESVTNTIAVLPRLEGSDLTKYFRNASQYRVKVLDDNGNPAKAGEIVTFNINGVFYNRTVGSDGYAKLSINLNPGDYIITTEYKGCRISNNIKVLPVLTGKDLTKKYGQAGAYEATLVDGQGKAYANQAVSFNINGVFYSRTTNSEGIAKLNINLMPGSYIITASYGQASISNTITVTG